MNDIKILLKSGNSFIVGMCDSEFLRLVNTLDRMFPPKTITFNNIGVIYTKEIEAVLKQKE